MKKVLASLIDSLTVFSLMLIGGFITPFMDDSETVHSDATDA